MIEELKAWFKDHQNNDNIAQNDTILHKAFAVIIYHIIKADNVETAEERKRFSCLFKQDFDLDEAHIHDLHESASKYEGDFDAYLEIIKDKTADLPSVKLTLMQNLNNIMQAHKFDEREFQIFEQVRKALFQDFTQ